MVTDEVSRGWVYEPNFVPFLVVPESEAQVRGLCLCVKTSERVYYDTSGVWY